MANFYYKPSDSSWYSDDQYTTAADITTIASGDAIYGNYSGYFEGGDLSNLDLRGVDFSNIMNAEHVNFSGSNLSGLNLLNLSFGELGFNTLNFSGANLTDARLPYFVSGYYGNRYFINGILTTLPESGTGWDSNSNVYYISGVATGLSIEGSGWNLLDNVYYIGGVATTLDEYGSGWDSNSSVYYISGMATGLSESGSGVWDGKLYLDGSEQLTGWNGYFYYIDNVQTDLYSDGNGYWNGSWYINGQIPDPTFTGCGWGGGTYGYFQNGNYLGGEVNCDGTGSDNQYYYAYLINGQPTELDQYGNGYWNGTLYGYESTHTGPIYGNYWNAFKGYFINGQLTELDESGNGTSGGLYYVSGVLFSGYDENSGIYYIGGQATELDSSGNGTWNGDNYANGVIVIPAKNGWIDGVYYKNDAATTLDEYGNGTWNGVTFVNGARPDGLLAFYQLSDLTDSSGNGNTLTNNGNVSFASGKIGNAAFGDGPNYLTSDVQIGGLQNLTFTFWTNHTDKTEDDTDQVFGSWYGGTGPMIGLFGSLGQYQAIGASTFGVALNTGEGMQFFWDQTPRTTSDWRFIAVKFVGGESLSIKINDEAWQTNAVNGTTLIAQSNLVRLLDGGDNLGLRNSKLDAFGIWNRALSDAEIAALYNNGAGLEVGGGSVNLESGLQAFYQLSDLTDSSGNGNTLTNDGNVSFAAGKIGNAAVFDGSNFLQSNVQQPSVAMTVSVWAKLNNTNGPRFLIDSVTGNNWSGGGFGITTDNGSVNSYVFHGGEGGEGVALSTGSVDLTLSADVWYHIVGTHDTSTGLGKLYINGSLNNSVQHNRNDPFGGDRTNPVAFGSNADGTYGMLEGQVDAVGIWNRALSEAEIAALYNNGAGLEVGGGSVNLESGLQAFYQLSNLTDSSGNGNTLTNNGNVTFAAGKIGNAAVFDGTNQLQKQPFNIGQNFTVSFWANLNEIVDYSFFVTQYAGFTIYTRQDGSLEVGDCSTWNFATASGVVETGVWKHYCLSVLNGVGTLYANNSVLGNSEGNPPFDLTDEGDRPFFISGESLVGYINGSIDAVGIWNRALSDAEVAALYNSGNGLELPTGPVIKNGWITDTYWINDVATSLDQNGDGTWVGKLYENGSLFSGSKYSLTFVAGVAQAEQIVTVIGNNISIAFGLNEAEEPLVELVFASITSAGETVIEQIIPTVLPTGYTVAETVLAYSIDTTATFEGTINVDFILPSNISQAVFDRVKGFHVKNSGSIEEMTRVSSDFSTKRITVAITSFSDFLFLDTPAPSGKLVKIQGNVKFYGKVKFGV